MATVAHHPKGVQVPFTKTSSRAKITPLPGPPCHGTQLGLGPWVTMLSKIEWAYALGGKLKAPREARPKRPCSGVRPPSGRTYDRGDAGGHRRQRQPRYRAATLSHLFVPVRSSAPARRTEGSSRESPQTLAMVMPVAAAGDPLLVRNTCIMAHVDHGKTTLADHLVAYGSGGGLLTPKWAGQARFMDHLPEERARAITMKSAAVALRHGAHRVHLIDSPGHLDFCSEVSAAARLADSALILVDVVDGVHVQTHAALRKAFAERLRPCLVLNKLDRLITELRLEPEEAYRRLSYIVAQVNSVYSDLRSGSYFSSLLDGPAPTQDVDDEDAFVPQKGNVVFACARDGWGFRIHDFAALYAQAHPDMTSRLLGGLWGAYCWDKKHKKVVGKDTMASMTNQQPMFAEFVLKPLWKAYKEGLKENGASWLRDQVVSRYSLKVSQRELQNKEPEKVLQAVLKAWLPLAETVMTMLVDCTPDPIAAQRFRVPKLMPKRELVSGVAAEHVSIVADADKVRRCVKACSTSARAPVVVFVSKMFGLAYKDLPSSGVDGELLNHTTNGSDDECFLAFARVFSGVLRAGQKVFVLSPMYDPLKGDITGKHLKEVELQHLYEMQGQDLRAVASVGAGNLVAIQGLGDHIMKTATLSSTRNCWPFASMMFQVSPLLKVAIEPSNLTDLGAFVNGLRLLNQADPLVECTQENGQYLLAAAGNVHLELCIKNLKERFAKNVEVNVSEPLVSFKETIQGGVGLKESLKGPQEFVARTAPDGKFAVRVKVIRLPDALIKVLEENEKLLSQTIEGQTARSNTATGLQLSQDDGRSVEKLRQHMLSAIIDCELEGISSQVDKVKLEHYRKTLLGYLQRIWALGPSQTGPNLLLSPNVRSSSGATTSQDGREGILVCGTCHISEKLGFTSEGFVVLLTVPLLPNPRILDLPLPDPSPSPRLPAPPLLPDPPAAFFSPSLFSDTKNPQPCPHPPASSPPAAARAAQSKGANDDTAREDGAGRGYHGCRRYRSTSRRSVASGRGQPRWREGGGASVAHLGDRGERTGTTTGGRPQLPSLLRLALIVEQIILNISELDRDLYNLEKSIYLGMQDQVYLMSFYRIVHVLWSMVRIWS
uniref:Uncharacterized protein n=1 Tax=Avena sativa TaxID=4498 RepID=A0ACD5YNX0_AVESA